MRQWQRRKTRDQSKEGKKAFQNLQRQLRLIQDENDVDCLYLGIVDAPTLSMIYLVDGAHEDACPPGCFDEYSRTIKQLCDMLCYTGHNRAIHDTHAPLYPKTALILELPTRDMLNNIFNKQVIGGLIFNRYLSNAIILHKTVLEGYIKGEKPLPPNFVDTPMPYPLQYPHDITPEMLGLMHQLEKTMDKDPDGFKKFMAKMAKEQNNKK